jgi:hypothetical protein
MTGQHSGGIRFQAGSLTQTLQLTFLPAQGQSAPAKLIYTGVGTAAVDVPFTLTDVPLS